MFLLLACTSAPTVSSSSVVGPLDFPEEGDTGTAITVDSGGDTESEVEPEPVYDEPDPPDLLINEVQTRNASTLLVSGSFPDWIEVYNASPETVDLSRISVIDSNDLPWHGPAGEVLAPGGYMLLYADGSLEGGMHAPFSFSGNGDQIVLKVDGYSVDRIATGELP